VSSADVGTGPIWGTIRAVALGPSGVIVAATPTGSYGDWFYRVDPTSGERSVVTQTTSSDGPFRAIAVSENGEMFTVGLSALWRLDEGMGGWALVSEGGAVGTGPMLSQPFDLAVARDGSLLVLSRPCSIFGAYQELIAVDPDTGDRTLLLRRPMSAVAVVPEPGGPALDAAAVLALAVLAAASRPAPTGRTS
jgi:hypothetical protein